jgi:hypothetical protein
MKWIGFFVLGIGTSLFAQQPANSDFLFRHLAGQWVLQGTIGHKQTIHDVDAGLVLKDEYVQLHEVSREKDASGAPHYEAIIFISTERPSGDFIALWLDNTAGGGLSASGLAHGTPSGNAIPFMFGSGADGIRNTFTYFPDRDEWTWAIDNESAGKFTPFARVTLTRAGAKR